MKQLVPKLTARLQSLKESASKLSVPKFTLDIPKEDNEIISQAWLWPRIGHFLKPKDVVLTETGEELRICLYVWLILTTSILLTGTAEFGILDIPFPEGAMSISQILWGSIGWTGGETD
jgi:pyruvate decarboxylase